jgi:hypothetical protein
MASVSSSCRRRHLRDRPRDLRDFERVREPRPVVIAGRRKEHLRLVLEAAERLGVNDAIAIALERRPDRILRSPCAAAPCCRRSSTLAAPRISRSRCSSCSRIDTLIDHYHYVPQKAGSVREAADAEILRERLPEIGEGRARAEVRARDDPVALQQDRHVLARMIRCSASWDRCRDPP